MGKIVVKAKKQFIRVANRQGYVQRAVRYNTIKYDELCEMVSSDSGISKAVVGSSLSAILKQCKQMLLNGHTLKIGSLFYLRLSSSAQSVENYDDVNADLIKRLRILVVPTGQIKTDVKNVQFEGEVVETEEP